MPKLQVQLELSPKEKAEADLDHYFKRWYDIAPTTPAQQEAGIDRVFQYRKKLHTVRYEMSAESETTGNVFFETTSQIGTTKITKGWPYTTEAKWVVIYQPTRRRVIILDAEKLRGRMRSWEGCFPQRFIPGRHQDSHGILVPEDILAVTDICTGTAFIL